MRYDVCVFGGCSIDEIFYEDGKTSLVVPGGKGANQAVAAARAGASVAMVTRIGKDEIGQKILDNLVYNGINTNNVEFIEGLSNDYAKIYIDAIDKDNKIERFSEAIDSFSKDMIEKYKNVFLNSKIVLSQLKAPKSVIVELINFCYDEKIPLILTPCRPARLSLLDSDNLSLIDKITYITANQEECSIIFGTNDIDECVSKYPNKLIVTLGNKGVVFHNGEKIVRILALKINNLEDTTGAGDTFCGNLAYALVNGMRLDDAIVRAQAAASMKIQKKSAQEGMPYKDELDSFMFDYLSKNLIQLNVDNN